MRSEPGALFDFTIFIASVTSSFVIWLETHCPGILVTPRLFRFYLNKSDPIRILSH